MSPQFWIISCWVYYVSVFMNLNLFFSFFLIYFSILLFWFFFPLNFISVYLQDQCNQDLFISPSFFKKFFFNEISSHWLSFHITLYLSFSANQEAFECASCKNIFIFLLVPSFCVTTILKDLFVMFLLFGFLINIYSCPESFESYQLSFRHFFLIFIVSFFISIFSTFLFQLEFYSPKLHHTWFHSKVSQQSIKLTNKCNQLRSIPNKEQENLQLYRSG